MNHEASPDPWADRAHQDVAQELGQAMMAAIRYRQAAQDAQRENEHLRQMLTQERGAHQATQQVKESLQEDLAGMVLELEKARAKAAPSARRIKS